jgi:hypothetical protein
MTKRWRLEFIAGLQTALQIVESKALLSDADKDAVVALKSEIAFIRNGDRALMAAHDRVCKAVRGRPELKEHLFAASDAAAAAGKLMTSNLLDDLAELSGPDKLQFRVAKGNSP